MLAAALLLLAQSPDELAAKERPEVIVGEITATTALLQARALGSTALTRLAIGVQGLDDSGAELDEASLLRDLEIPAQSAGIVRLQLSDLIPDTHYSWSVFRVEDGVVVDTIVPVEIVTEYIVCATTPKAAAGPQNLWVSLNGLDYVDTGWLGLGLG